MFLNENSSNDSIRKLSPWDSSNNGSQHMFLCKIIENNPKLSLLLLLTWSTEHLVRVTPQIFVFVTFYFVLDNVQVI